MVGGTSDYAPNIAEILALDQPAMLVGTSMGYVLQIMVEDHLHEVLLSLMLPMREIF